MDIRALKPTDLQDLLRFSDAYIGAGYFNKMTMLNHINNSRKDGVNCSFVMVDDGGEIQGLRLTFPPGMWQSAQPQHVSPRLWIHPRTHASIPIERVGYFKSLFVATKYQGQGWGTRLSQMSIAALRQLDTQAVLSHSWIQSPKDSSSRYLSKLGFVPVARHSQFWKGVDYQCPRCGYPCHCDALEMILYL